MTRWPGKVAVQWMMRSLIVRMATIFVIEAEDTAREGKEFAKGTEDGVEYVSIMFEMKNEDVTIKRLTNGNPTMNAKFDEAQQRKNEQ